AGEASLARAAVERFGDDADRTIEVGVRHDDDEVFRATESLNPLTRMCPALVDVFRDGCRADERHGADTRVIADGIDDVAAAVDDVDDPGWQVAAAQQLHHLALRERDLLRWLQDERVAGGNRKRQKPHWHHRRKVERRDGGADAEGLAHDMAVDPLRY